MLWLCPEKTDASADRELEAVLRRAAPAIDWSVKNQARMHIRNGDAPYRSVADAMRYWPETATAVAVRLAEQGELEIVAPFGLEDLFELVLRPTPKFAGEKRRVYRDRVQSKEWLAIWPLLRTQE